MIVAKARECSFHLHIGRDRSALSLSQAFVNGAQLVVAGDIGRLAPYIPDEKLFGRLILPIGGRGSGMKFLWMKIE